MKPEEFGEYHLLKSGIPFWYTNKTIIAYDFEYDKKNRNDLSKIGFALLYDHNTNIIAFTKFDKNTGDAIFDNETSGFEIDTVIDRETFLIYIKYLNVYCLKHNCDYKTVLDKKIHFITYNEDDDQEKEPLYVVFDKDNKTTFMYLNNKIKFAKKFKDDSFVGIIRGDIEPEENIKSFEKFEKFTKNYKPFIDQIINRKLEAYKKQKLEKLTGANSEFASHGHERR